MKKIFIGWWGSIKNGGETIGDLFAVDAVVSKLYNYDITIGSFINYDLIKKYSINPLNLNPLNFDIFIFVCGPLIKESKQLNNLINSFQNSIKIAVGVSVLKNELMSFDYILPRDSTYGDTFFDVALSSPYLKTLKKKYQGIDKKYVGLCLRGFQREYGNENCLNEKVDNIINKFLDLKTNKLLILDTRLDRIDFDYSTAYLNFHRCKFIITTRLHGTLLSINSNTAFVSIDQIKGGAKVYNLRKELNCNFIYKVNQLEGCELLDSYNNITKIDNDNELLKFQKTALLRSENTLKKMIEIIKNI